MAELSRYNVSQSHAGLDGVVLKNKLGITDPQELIDAETLLLNDAYEYFLEKITNRELVLSGQSVFELHQYIFDPLYEWAGIVRTVDISKEGMLFAPVAHLKGSIEYMCEIINTHLPNEKNTIQVVSEKLAIIHNEYNAVHPFREGNGRTVRLFMDLLLVSIGYQTIDYTQIDHKKYIQACIAGMSQNHKPLKKILLQLIRT